MEIECGGVLFDMDGVLIDSTPAVARVWSRWAIEHGLRPEEVVRRAHGRPSIESIQEMLPGADPEAENLKVETAEVEDTEGIVPLPGACELLETLPRERWTIVTSCTRRLAEVRLRAAGLKIPPLLVTSNDIVKGKPNPEPYLKGASFLGVGAEDCIVVEDVPAGILSGKAMGARVIAVRTTSSDTELQNAGADWIVDGCSAISVKPSNGGVKLEVRLR